MSRAKVAIVGAAETTELGEIPDKSQLAAPRRRRAQRARRLRARPSRTSTASRPPGESPVAVAHYLGITPSWLDGTAGRRLLVHDPRAPRGGGDRGGPVQDRAHHARPERPLAGRRRRLARRRRRVSRASSRRRTEPRGRRRSSRIPALRYMKDFGLTHEQLAMVAVVQREWAGQEPARHAPRPDRRRRRARLAGDRLPVPPARVLSRDRRRRRAGARRRRSARATSRPAPSTCSAPARAPRRPW